MASHLERAGAKDRNQLPPGALSAFAIHENEGNGFGWARLNRRSCGDPIAESGAICSIIEFNLLAGFENAARVERQAGCTSLLRIQTSAK
jgi:hypothetical protein